MSLVNTIVKKNYRLTHLILILGLNIDEHR
jgi:hypothetical protein